MSLVKAVRLGQGVQLTRRRMTDISDLREAIEAGEVTALLHVNGSSNPVDISTKPLARCAKTIEFARKIFEQGIYVPDISNAQRESKMSDHEAHVIHIYATCSYREEMCLRALAQFAECLVTRED